jgi:CheY-like chemotaxis protein
MSYKILVVDDDFKTLDISARLLQTQRYEVITAVNGAEGIVRAKAEKPDLILMDLKMPTMDGKEATSQLKAGQQTRDIPIIVVSALPMDDTMNCDEFVSKPIVWAILFEKIELLLSKE